MRLILIAGALVVFGTVLEICVVGWLGRYPKYQVLAYLATLPIALLTGLVIVCVYASVPSPLALVYSLIAIAAGVFVSYGIITRVTPRKIKESDHRGAI